MSDDPAGAPRLKHGGRAGGLDGDHPGLGRNVFQGDAHAAGERAVAKAREHGVEGLGEGGQLEPDRAGTFAGFDVETVFDHADAEPCGGAFRLELGIVEIVAEENHVGPERAHAVDFERVRHGAGIHRQWNPPSSTGIGHRLAEIAGACGDEAFALTGAGNQIVGTATLEAPDRIHCLDFDHEAQAEERRQRFGDELGCVEEDGVDHAQGIPNVFELQPVRHGEERGHGRGEGQSLGCHRRRPMLTSSREPHCDTARAGRARMGSTARQSRNQSHEQKHV